MSDTLHAGLGCSILDVVSENSMTDVVFRPYRKRVQRRGEQTCPHVVFQANIARSALSSVVSNLIPFISDGASTQVEHAEAPVFRPR